MFLAILGGITIMKNSQSISVRSYRRVDTEEYRRQLHQGLGARPSKTCCNFGVLPEVSLNAEKYKNVEENVKVREAYYQITHLAKQAVLEGNLNKLKACLGPSLYSSHQQTNRRIHQLRWRWMKVQERQEAYAQLFQLILTYARQLACEGYISLLRAELGSLESKIAEQRAIQINLSSTFPRETWIFMGNGLGYRRAMILDLTQLVVEFSQRQKQLELVTECARKLRYITDSGNLLSVRTFEDCLRENEHQFKAVFALTDFSAEDIKMLQELVRQNEDPLFTRLRSMIAKVKCEEENYKTQLFSVEQVKTLQDFLKEKNATALSEKLVLKSVFPEDLLLLIYKHVKCFPPKLSSSALICVKKALLNCLYALPERHANYLENIVHHTFEKSEQLSSPDQVYTMTPPHQLAPYSVPTVLPVLAITTFNAVCKAVKEDAFKSAEIKAIAGEVEIVLMETNNLAELLNYFYLAWQEQENISQSLEEEYRFLVNKQQIQTKREELLAEYKERADSVLAYKKMGFRSIDNDIFDEGEAKKTLSMKVCESNIGEVSLADLPWPTKQTVTLPLTKQANSTQQTIVFSTRPGLESVLLTAALEQLQHPRATDEIRACQLNIIAYLIHRGCPLNLLPWFKVIPQGPDIISAQIVPWHILIAVLQSLVCVTLVANRVRQVLFDYAEKNKAREDDEIGLHRRQAITLLVSVIGDGQRAEKLQEERLLKIMKEQIDKSPRGWFGRSELYSQLQGVLIQTQGAVLKLLSSKMMAVDDQKKVIEGKEVFLMKEERAYYLGFRNKHGQYQELMLERESHAILIRALQHKFFENQVYWGHDIIPLMDRLLQAVQSSVQLGAGGLMMVDDLSEQLTEQEREVSSSLSTNKVSLFQSAPAAGSDEGSAKKVETPWDRYRTEEAFEERISRQFDCTG